MTAGPPPSGPILFAYDGSDLAKIGIDEAGRVLNTARDALVVCVWQPVDVGFVVPIGLTLDARQAPEIRDAAQRTAAEGASLAEAAGFAAHSTAIEASPIWKGIVEIADERDASLIVFGSHGRTGAGGVLFGSVAGTAAAHSHRTVLIAHRPRT